MDKENPESDMDRPSTMVMTVPVFWTPDGRPTCAANFVGRKTCPFLLVSGFGQRYSCHFSRQEDGHLFDYAEGYLQPGIRCPVHPNMGATE